MNLLTARMRHSANRDTGLHVLKMPTRAAELTAVREGSTGRIVVVPRVWAVAEARSTTEPEQEPPPELAFYRKYTEALLRRYLRLSMQSGRVPSLLSRDLFRGHVTRYNVRSFEEVVIFCHDVEQRLARLNATEKQIIANVVLQRYSLEEAAGMVGVSVNTLRERYRATIDRLTGMLLEAKLLDPQRP